MCAWRSSTLSNSNGIYRGSRADIYINSGVVGDLAPQVILGQDIPILRDQVQLCRPVYVVTRSKKQSQVGVEGDGARGLVVSEGAVQGQQQVSWGPAHSDPKSEMPYFEYDIPLENSLRDRKSRHQRRWEKMSGTARLRSGHILDLEEPCADLPAIFQQLQRHESLKGCFSQAISLQEGDIPEESVGEGYLLRVGVLYYPEGGGGVNQHREAGYIKSEKETGVGVRT